MDEYDEYLAVHVLNEKEIVTYRTLSRALKVHVNLAKQMLWDFHHRTNNKRSGSVHATYLLSGLRKTTSTSTRTTQSKDGEDTVMASSPPLPGSSMPQQDEDEPSLTRSLLLVKEEHLDKAKATFTELRSIHIYSLEAEGLNDLQTLTQCTKQIFEKLGPEDPLKDNTQYGTIQNAFVKRRSRKTPLAPGSTMKAAPPKQASAPVKEEPKAAVKMTTKAAAAKTASLKRQGSDIMSSFAKNAAKPKPASKVEAKEAEDSPMADISDDEYVDAADVDIEVKEAGGKSKQDRQAELEAMMDVEDEPKEPEKEDEDMDAAETPQAEPEPEAQEKESVTVENGRRRGRRKIKVKKRVKDENGYLITREEEAWESFSEEEPASKKTKTTAAPPTKKTAKVGQGNIMSFFGKK